MAAFGGPLSVAHFWMGGASAGTSTQQAPAFRSMMHFWMGGVDGGSAGPGPGAGFEEPPYFIVNMGRMMNRRGM